MHFFIVRGIERSRHSSVKCRKRMKYNIPWQSSSRVLFSFITEYGYKINVALLRNVQCRHMHTRICSMLCGPMWTWRHWIHIIRYEYSPSYAGLSLRIITQHVHRELITELFHSVDPIEIMSFYSLCIH